MTSDIQPATHGTTQHTPDSYISEDSLPTQHSLQKKEKVGMNILIIYTSIVSLTSIVMIFFNQYCNRQLSQDNDPNYLSKCKTFNIIFLIIQVIGFMIYLALLNKYENMPFGTKLYVSISVISIFILFYIVIIFIYAGPLLFTIFKMISESDQDTNNIGLFYHVIRNTTLGLVYYIDLIIVIFMFAFFFYNFGNLLL